MNPIPRSDAHRSLTAGLTLIRQFVPTATAVRLEISDSGLEGFQLVEVLTADHLELSLTEPDLLSNLIDDTWRHFRHLPWNGIVGEDEHGTAQLTLPTAPLPEKTVWTCLTCGFFCDKLRADRDTDHLRQDGAHYPNWHTDDEDGTSDD